MGRDKCPDCGHPVVLKNGKFGFFFGCTNYPNCRFSCSMDYMGGETIFDIDRYEDYLLQRELDAVVMESEHGDYGCRD